MTLHYEITKAIHTNRFVRLCVDCRYVALGSSDFIEYPLDLSSLKSRNITGTMCPDCLDYYHERKLARLMNNSI